MTEPTISNLTTRFWTNVKGTQLSQAIANSFSNYFSGITASTTQTQAAGAKLNYGANEIDTCVNSGDACVMPAAIPGRWVEVMNNGAQPSNIFPAGTDKINNGSAGAALSQANAKMAKYTCMKTGLWFRNLSA